MLCAHEPALDPRVQWEAKTAAGKFDVTVLGFEGEVRTDSACEKINSYAVVHVRRQRFAAARYFWQLKDARPVGNRVVLIATLAVSLPAVLIGDILIRGMRPFMRRWLERADVARHDGIVRHASGAERDSSQLEQARRSFPARLYRIFDVFGCQFAPATVLFSEWIRQLREKPHVIHCNDLDTLLVGVLARQFFGCRIVYDAHEFYPESDPHGMWIERVLFSAVERVLIRRCDAVVTVNPMLAEVMRGRYGLDKVYSAPNAELWRGCPSRSRDDDPIAKLARGRTKFLFQGRFAPSRGIEEIISGWAQVDGEKAALFLRGPASLWRRAAIDQARQLGLLDKSVYFLDPVGEDALIDAAAAADVGIIPYKPLVTNDRFACPNKLSQYMHAGLMILTNDLPYVKSVVTEAQAGFAYSSWDPASFVDIVHQIVNNPGLAQRCRDNALAYARRTFNWQVQGNVLLDLYAGPRDRMGSSKSDGFGR